MILTCRTRWHPPQPIQFDDELGLYLQFVTTSSGFILVMRQRSKAVTMAWVDGGADEEVATPIVTVQHLLYIMGHGL